MEIQKMCSSGRQLSGPLNTAKNTPRIARISVASLLLLLLSTSDAFVLRNEPQALHNHHGPIYAKASDVPEKALERTAAHLERLSKRQPTVNQDDPQDKLAVERQKLYQEYIQQPANALKVELKKRELPMKGTKPDLANRLAEDDLQEAYGLTVKAEFDGVDEPESKISVDETMSSAKADTIVKRFAGLKLSGAAGLALGKARFASPTPIQAAALLPIAKGESLLLHAETGSGKTLTYTLPATERLWKDTSDESFTVILTPTRELASQVAGVASVLAPPGTVRLVSRPTNLMSDGLKDRGQLESGGYLNTLPAGTRPRLFVGSAKAIMHSLYGDGKMPAPPTSKPEAMEFLKNVRYLVLDEVDRLLAVKKTRSEKKQSNKQHEKPAAVVTAAITRSTLGQAQIVAASATVGRPLKREFTRVLGLPFQECPRVVRGEETQNAEQDAQVQRAVTLPPTIRNYVYEVDGSSSGSLLTSAYQVLERLNQQPRKVLMVLSKGFDINTQNVIGALKHFKCDPEPQSLLDALEATEGSDYLIEKHRQVSGATGIGETSYFDQKETKAYCLVTGEDSVRGLHLDGLDTVLVLGRAKGPDEYTHIAGRTGRAGKVGNVINIVSNEDGAALESWQRMLDVKFKTLQLDEINNL